MTSTKLVGTSPPSEVSKTSSNIFLPNDVNGEGRDISPNDVSKCVRECKVRNDVIDMICAHRCDGEKLGQEKCFSVIK